MVRFFPGFVGLGLVISGFVREPYQARGVHKIAYYHTEINSTWILWLHLDLKPPNI